MSEVCSADPLSQAAHHGPLTRTGPGGFSSRARITRSRQLTLDPPWFALVNIPGGPAGRLELCTALPNCSMGGLRASLKTTVGCALAHALQTRRPGALPGSKYHQAGL